MKVNDIVEAIEKFCPSSYAESWDNPGLTVNPENREVGKILLALDATDAVIDFAIENNADMIITHHPMIFSPVKKISNDDFTGRRIIKLIKHNIPLLALHTNYDVAFMGELAARRLGIKDIEPLDIMEDISGEDKKLGIGTKGVLESPVIIRELADRLKEAFALDYVNAYFNDADRKVEKVAMCPGSGKSLIKNALDWGADVYITGDVDYHSAVDALENDLMIIDPGHYGVEHCFIDDMAEILEEALEGVEILKYTIINTRRTI